MQREERWLQRVGFLRVQAHPLMHEVGVETVAQGGTGLEALLNDLGSRPEQRPVALCQSGRLV